MSGIKIAQVYLGAKHSGDNTLSFRGVVNNIQREVSGWGRRGPLGHSAIRCLPSIRSCLLMFDKGGYLSWVSKFAYWPVRLA